MATPSSEAQNNQLPILLSADFPFGEKSTAVISDAYKFVIPVPDLGEAAEPLIYPAGHERAGQPILDYKNQPVGDWGIVFFNEKDQSYQAVPADGEGVIIVNEVSPEQAEKIDRKVRSLTGELTQLSSAHIKEILKYAQRDLELGDTYNSDKTYVKTKLTTVLEENTQPQKLSQPSQQTEETCYGFRKRDSQDIYQAVFVPGQFRIEGPAVTFQIFTKGGVIIKQGKTTRGIQPEVFVRTYRLASGQPITDLEKQVAIRRLPWLPQA